jgi:hypothetical protein
MRRFRSGVLGWVAAVLSILSIGGCGGHPPAGQSPFIARIILNPGGNSSIQIGSFIGFSASATNAAGNNVGATFTYSSSDTSILNIASNGAGCAGRWDAAFTSCTPGGTGVVKVTASAQGATSPPTFVFVHPPIDNIKVIGVLLDNLPIQEPCLTQGQTMTVEAHAFSQGADVTATVGPFTWSASNSSVVTVTPLVNSAYNFATNQATAIAATPGISYINATASGVSSNSFLQPDLSHFTGVTSVPFDFFETCPIQNIALELGHAGSLQTSFAVTKGTSQTVIATVTDVMGNSSLPNATNQVALSKIPLTWTASQPGSVSVASGCSLSCAVSTPLPGSGSVTASCSPPSCNVGFPLVPAAFSPASLAQCAQYVHSLLPQVNSCKQFIPLPVYASPLPAHTTAAISGVVSGATSAATIIATSQGCAKDSPITCSTGIYNFSTSKASAGSATGMPVNPNSLLVSPAGDKFYVGSDFGAQLLTPANLGSQTSAFTGLGTVTGRVIAVSPNGNLAIFSDSLHTPNQVYIVNESNAGAATVSALNISESSAAAFSPDGLKAFIFGQDSNHHPTLYIYSTLQAVQVISLPSNTTVNSISFSTNGAFAYVVEPSLGGGNPAISVYNTCDNQLFTDTLTGLHDIPLAGAPVAFRVLPDGTHFLVLESDGTIESFTASITGIPPATISQAATQICPMTVGHSTPIQINLGQGKIDPINFFVSADGTLIYVAARELNSILTYNFSSGGRGGIQLVGANNPTPIAADMTVDAGFILVAGSDGLVHQLSTATGGFDQAQFGFPNLVNYLNPFCTFTPASGACTFDYVAARP